MQPKQKVLAYITRTNEEENELLVFNHTDFPESGIQVPGGSGDAGEDPVHAVKREVKEETGLTF